MNNLNDIHLKHQNMLIFDYLKKQFFSFDIIKDKKHLTLEGLQEIVSIRASLNKGLPERLKLAFPKIKHLDPNFLHFL